MHSALVRLQNVFGFFTSVAFAVAAVVAVSSYTFPTSPTADISIRNVQVYVARRSLANAIPVSLESYLLTVDFA